MGRLDEFVYPKTGDDAGVPDRVREQFAGVHRVHDSGDIDAVFGGHAQAPTPWPREPRSKAFHSYDANLVHEALANRKGVEEVDPRYLHATQPNVTRAGVDHYMHSDYETTGETYADRGNLGNQFPVVYRRDDGINLLLSGHHRATKALIAGEALRARTVDGPWGRPR